MHWIATITIEDDKGKKSPLKLHLSTPSLVEIVGDADDPVDFLQYWVGLLDQAIDGAVTNISLSTRVELPAGLKEAPNQNADVEQGLSAAFRVGSSKRDSRLRFPTWKEDYLTAGGTLAYLAGDPVADLFFNLTHGEEAPANWVVHGCNARGDRLRGVIEAASKEVFRSNKE